VEGSIQDRLLNQLWGEEVQEIQLKCANTWRRNVLMLQVADNLGRAGVAQVTTNAC